LGAPTSQQTRVFTRGERGGDWNIDMWTELIRVRVRWNTVYPLYFDAKVSINDGRRVPRKDALWWPQASHISQACRVLGLPSVLEVGTADRRRVRNIPRTARTDRVSLTGCTPPTGRTRAASKCSLSRMAVSSTPSSRTVCDAMPTVSLIIPAHDVRLSALQAPCFAAPQSPSRSDLPSRPKACTHHYYR
jgi:signal recognition particle subunit SEC65